MVFIIMSGVVMNKVEPYLQLASDEFFSLWRGTITQATRDYVSKGVFNAINEGLYFEVEGSIDILRIRSGICLGKILSNP